jgi:iron complex outermembrane receptor protein|tara:strand:+ start:788 stop:2890 length:2103 start_codon:yes stop_codon:yes gene_type:complete
MKITKYSLLFSFFIITFSFEIIPNEIEEVVVKGQWRENLISQEDSSIFVIDSQVAEDQAIKHFQQLTYLIPNLNYAASDSRARYFQIRGIGERSGYQGTPNSSVGFLIDDIDYSGQGSIATTFDIDQIEIYRGPQGSRTGANALAGLIYIKTKDPTDKFERLTELTLGEYGTQNIGIAFGGPIKNNKLKYRMVLRSDYSDGFRKNIYLNKSDTSKKDELTLRYKLHWDLNQTTKIKLLFSQVDIDDPADIWTIDGSLNTLSDRPGMDSQKTDSFGLKIFKDLEHFDIQSYTSATNTDVVFSYDADWGNPESHYPYTYDYFSETYRKRDTLRQELRILSKSKDFSSKSRLKWVFGVDFNNLKETNLTNDDGIYGDPSDPFSPYLSESSISRDYEADNFSLFGNIDYFLSENYLFTFGLRRENWDSKYNDSNKESFNPSDSMNGGKASLIKNYDDSSNIYFSIARGYKQGGFNLNLDALDIDSNNSLIYDPEFLTNYEIGFNSNINLSLNYSAILFFSQRDDQQVLISRQVDPNDPNTFSFLTQNAAEGENYGFEFSSKFMFTNDIILFANLGLLKTKIKNWESRPDLEGRAQAHSPERSYSIGMNANLTPNINFKINFNGKSSFYYSDSHDNKSDSYVLTNITLSYKKQNSSINIWARNIFNKYYSTRGFYFGNEAPNFVDTLYKRQGDPKIVGISIRHNF